MILKKIEKQVNGDLLTQWLLTEAQTAFLINYAVAALVERGLAEVIVEKLDEAEAQKDLLESLDENQLYQA